MSGKGLPYWRQAWNDAGFLEDYQKADYLLKRYARQSFNTYGKEIADFYFGPSRSIFVPSINSKSCRLTPNRKSMDSVIKDLQGILDDRSIYRNGDLHNILQVFEENTHQKYTDSFSIVEKPSLFSNFVFLEWFFSFLQKCFGNDPVEEKEKGCSL
ncbi:hypothetical protein [Legionella sp. WA2022007384]